MKPLLTAKQIRRAVSTLRKNQIEPVNGVYWAQPSIRSIIDILLTYKRPRATKFYRRLK